MSYCDDRAAAAAERGRIRTEREGTVTWKSSISCPFENSRIRVVLSLTACNATVVPSRFIIEH